MALAWTFALTVALTVELIGLMSNGQSARANSAQVNAGSAERSQADELLRRIPAIFGFAADQYQSILARIDSGVDRPGGILRALRGLLRSEVEQPRSFIDGKLKLVGAQDWTSGFFPGSLWYLFEYTQEAKWKTAAQRYTEGLESLKDFRGHHDVGFMLNSSFGNGYRLTQDPRYRSVLIQGAQSLTTRFAPAVGMIRSWDYPPWQFPVIVDNLMNLELLTWSAAQTGDERLRDIAVRHADNTLKHHLRADASSFHLVDFDPAIGTVLKKQTVQGAADSSTWARGQAWGLYGYTMLFRETRRPEYLAQAEKMALFILNHPRLPADKIPYWDFDTPEIPNTQRDAAAAAIMASALLELSAFVQAPNRGLFAGLARQQLLSLSSPAYLARPNENGGFLLMHAVGSRPGNSEVDVPLNYADYYFLEALLRYRRLAATQ